MTAPARILVAGAGPAGLALALQARAHGAVVRMIDRRTAAWHPSRALIMHARTLEVLRPLGVTPEILCRADTAPAAYLHLGSSVVRMELADLPMPDTAFPHLTLIRQMDVEEVLEQALADRGVTVEYGTELLRACDGPATARAVIRSRNRVEDAAFDYIAGCDGAASTVRSQAGIGWAGGPYPVEIVLADVELGDDFGDGAAHVAAGRRGLLFAFRLGERATWRLLATRPAGPGAHSFGQLGPPVPLGDIEDLLKQAGLAARITRLAWSARVRVQHRVADEFRRGRLFLAGDAAHAYSPATGQGMNAAIQDAANLGWKLALAAPGSPSEAVLGSYEQERRKVARHVLAMSHVAFWGEASTCLVPSLLRGRLAPLATPALPWLAGRRRLMAAAFRLVSALRVSYRDSPLSVEGTPAARGARAGDRLPDQPVSTAERTVRLHELLARPGVHVLLDRDAPCLDTRWLGPHVSVHRLVSSPGRGMAVVRPDGYIGLRCSVAEMSQLAAWLGLVGPSGTIAT